jgi:hypothetical protein
LPKRFDMLDAAPPLAHCSAIAMIVSSIVIAAFSKLTFLCSDF